MRSEWRSRQRGGPITLRSLDRSQALKSYLFGNEHRSDLQTMVDMQLCRLKRNVTPAIIFRELSERPWVHRWWIQVIGFLHRLSNVPDDSIHAELLRDNIADAQQHWAGGTVKQ